MLEKIGKRRKMKKGHTQMKTIEFAFDKGIFLIYLCIELGDFDTIGAFGMAQNSLVAF